MAFQVSDKPSRWAQYCPQGSFDYCAAISGNDFVITWEINAFSDTLTGVRVEPAPNGLISSITSNPAGQVEKIGTATTVVMNWDASDGRWEPASEFGLDDGAFYEFTVTINVDLTTGDSCSHDISTQFQYIDLGTAPTASPTISGIQQVGYVLTGSDGYNSVDGAPQDSAGTVRRWYSYTDAAGTVGETLLGSGSTYTLTASEANKYIRFKVIPAATTGPSPGAEAQSAVFGGIAPDTIAIQFGTTSSGTIAPDLTVNTDQIIGVDWGDGNLEFFNLTSGSATGLSHTYSSGSTKDVEIFCTPTTVTEFEAQNIDMTGTLEIASCSSMEILNVSSNSALTSIDNPSCNWSQYLATSCNIGSLTFPSGTSWNDGNVQLTSNSNLTSVDFFGNSGTFSVLFFNNCDITGTLDLSTVNFNNSAQLRIQNNSSLTAINHGSTTGNFYRYWVDRCDLTGTHTIPQNIDSSITTNRSIRIDRNSNLTNLVLSGSCLFNEIRAYNCDLTGTIDFSNVDFEPSATVRFDGNGSLNSINFGSGKTGTLQTINAQNCDLTYFSFGGITFTSSGNVSLGGNSMTAAEVNEWLVNFDPSGSGEDLFPASGTGSLSIGGSNAAPDTTSGGFDGVAAAASIASAGYTVTTS